MSGNYSPESFLKVLNSLPNDEYTGAAAGTTRSAFVRDHHDDIEEFLDDPQFVLNVALCMNNELALTFFINDHFGYFSDLAKDNEKLGELIRHATIYSANNSYDPLAYRDGTMAAPDNYSTKLLDLLARLLLEVHSASSLAKILDKVEYDSDVMQEVADNKYITNDAAMKERIKIVKEFLIKSRLDLLANGNDLEKVIKHIDESKRPAFAYEVKQTWGDQKDYSSMNVANSGPVSTIMYYTGYLTGYIKHSLFGSSETQTYHKQPGEEQDKRNDDKGQKMG